MWKGLRGSEEGVDDVEEGVDGTDVVVVVSMASARAVVNVEKREVANAFKPADGWAMNPGRMTLRREAICFMFEEGQRQIGRAHV